RAGIRRGWESRAWPISFCGCQVALCATAQRQDESVELEEQVWGDVADEVDDHVAAGEAPVDRAAELVAVTTGHDRWQRHGVGLLEHRVIRTARCDLPRVVDLDHEVGGDVFG